ncbi:MAG: alpha/beta hydrolase [Nannocystaceae bacterium]
MSPTAPETRTIFVESPGARLAVDVDGDGPPAVLLCHGGPGGPDDFADLRARLAELGIACARFDQRGVHRSENRDGRWDIDAYAEDVEAIREALGVTSLVIFGHSWGGVVARAWAKAHPERVRGLLLASPSAAVGPAWREMEAQVMAYLRRRVSFGTWIVIGLWSLVAMIPGRIGSWGMGRVYAHVMRAYTGQREVPGWVRHSSARSAHLSRVAIRKIPADALDVLGLPPGTPARAVFGDDDIYGPIAQRFAETATELETTFLPHCGHVLWRDAPEAWDRWLVDGLAACGLLEASRSPRSHVPAATARGTAPSATRGDT